MDTGNGGFGEIYIETAIYLQLYIILEIENGIKMENYTAKATCRQSNMPMGASTGVAMENYIGIMIYPLLKSLMEPLHGI
jgi:hypothetical protein